MQLVTPDDRPRDRFISGRMGAAIKELICSFVTGSLRVERHFAGAYTWPRGLEAHDALVAANDANEQRRTSPLTKRLATRKVRRCEAS